MKLKFLIIDDEEAVAIVLKKMLAKRNIESTIVNSYSSAVDMVKKETFDMILTDRWLNGIDGTAIISELKKQNKQMPVIIMTGSEDLVHSEIKYITLKKPFEFAELEKAANKLGLFF